MMDFLSGLNQRQKEATSHFVDPILVLAGAGSGKTRVLVHRIAHLILHHGVHPGSILAVTFTNKAANEMKVRVEQMLGSDGSIPWIATFHSACLRILRREATRIGFGSNFVVYDTQDAKNVLKKIIESKKLDIKKYSPAHFLYLIDSCKNSDISFLQVKKNPNYSKIPFFAEIYELYQKALFSSNGMDFGDLIFNCLVLFREHQDVLSYYQSKFKFILVDEFQDTNAIQYAFLKYITPPQKNIFVVGDDDQSIYSFRGADISNILNFESDFKGSKIVRLEQNYRSTQVILDAAHDVISKNHNRKSKKLWTENGTGEKITYFIANNEEGEARFVAKTINELNSTCNYRDISILYRTNAQSRSLEEALTFAKIPYKVFGGLRFYDRKEVKDMLSYLRFLYNPKDTEALLRIINVPTRGIGAQSVDRLLSFLQSGESIFVALEELSKTSKAFDNFFSLINKLLELTKILPIDELYKAILDHSGYVKSLELSSDVQSESRIENVEELGAFAKNFIVFSQDPKEQLGLFLDRVSLATSSESLDDEYSDNAVSLMTLHLAKGLEFQTVFITGVEDNLIPHSRSKAESDDIEEERRLFYVGITRAKKSLYLCRAESRSSFSSYYGSQNFESPFVCTISSNLIEEIHEDQETSYLKKLPTKSFEKYKSNKSSSDNSLVNSLIPASELQELKESEYKLIVPGVTVEHQSYGRGKVTHVEQLDADSLASARVGVHFEKSNDMKLFVLKFANLRVAN
jgi:DNA helicase II / ATP-dependent DNA helicase PcrA